MKRALIIIEFFGFLLIFAALAIWVFKNIVPLLNLEGKIGFSGAVLLIITQIAGFFYKDIEQGKESKPE